ncbi:polyprenol-phosphate-mannose-dependent alpha-(1-2)-phosphatidylinositol mannoside mannosyltransferase [Mycolicibacterium anyangense]|uniref:Polyprenol-phosphate-mannose-dependent alpha-(1-2)-phosphatidylinositol mannoside mannosyltransferase n=1 Tax=Mycolicibacterium anyangense TaxID=1431246 RepID=A0A6N4W8V7_9MYCO|nr:glycosyltransferase 87 family protein [Mycolicibacterium anyangense]BBZ76474.1 polyprenol-phosphate-mannose-dependent alpha-(1-2)-phosphatidylinositol mannoside mannosyltransferase [Mycolicibacterium anyangense]
MSTWQASDGGSVFGRVRLSPKTAPWLTVAWRASQLVIVALLVYAGWSLLGHIPYRIDIDVYRMGAQAWLDGRPLYAGDATFHTRIGLDLPFTYPPLAAIVFSPFAWLGLDGASIAITVITLVLLLLSTWIVLTRLDVWQTSSLTREPVWLRRCWLSAGIVALSVIYLEPITANFAFGQINVVLMTLVIADCVPRRTPWPRGLLLGVAIALKLTPAVFLLYFVLRRDVRATVTAFATFIAASVVGFVFAWQDSVEYWTTTVRHTDRIGSAALNTNQNIAGSLARLGLGHSTHFLLWTAACVAVLGLTIWTVRRVVLAGEPTLALICVALFGLMVSPVSWSHHWVWALPTIVVTMVLGYRRRNIALAALGAVGVALMVWIPLELMPKHHEETASWWRQLLGMSYVWWALAVLVVAGLTVRTPATTPQPSPGSAPVADLVRPA